MVANGLIGALIAGYVAQSAELMSQALEYLIADPVARDKLAAAAGGIVQRFSVERVMAMWEAVFAATMPESQGR